MSDAVQRIAVVGGGPAGAFLAEKLAREGRQVLLFDERLAWEKPCGGGLTEKAIARWPFLGESEVERNWISQCELIAPNGRKVSFRLDRQIAIFSRITLNRLLLERAQKAGAQLYRERITRVERHQEEWALACSSDSWRADFVILATGARNSLCRFSEPLRAEDLMVAAGYYIPGSHHKLQIKFLKNLHGYMWVFPRADHFSAGICGRMGGASTAELRLLLETSLPELGLGLENATFYAHIIPSLGVRTLTRRRFAGKSWAMVGDAAGFVDAITGEGLYYALRSAELLASALLRNTPDAYPALAAKDFLPELEHAARVAERFYQGSWMGGPVIERMVHLTGRSPHFRELMRDLFAGAQNYSRLRQRLYRSLPRIAAESLISALSNHPGAFAGAGNRT